MPQARFYTTEQISAHQSLTPEGYLLCLGVPLARTGIQLYAEGEVPIEAGPDGLIRVDRPEEEVFRPETIASFNGKTIVIEHPVDDGEPVDVNPENWQQFTVGSILNPRRGTGVEDDVMLGDLMFYDPKAIQLVRSGQMSQVSCGYDADYEDLGGGRAVQRDIIGNHVALVEAGRCGPLCSVRDDNSKLQGVKRMSSRQSYVRDLLSRAFRARDAEELEELEKEAGKKLGDSVNTQTESGNTGEGSSDPNGESLHIHLHQGGGEGSAGAGGSATGDEDPAGGAGAGGGGGGAEAVLQAILKAVTDLCAKFDMAMGAGGEGDSMGGEPAGRSSGWDPETMMSRPGEDGDLDIHHSADAEGEENFDPQENKRIKTGGFSAEAPPGAAGAENSGSRDRRRSGRDARMMRDSSSLAEAWQDTMALAEILSPGVRTPTFDRAAKGVITLDRMCKFRRRVLNAVYDTDMDMHNVLDNLVDSPRGYSPQASMTCDAVSHLFRAAAQVKRDRNNTMMGRDQNGGAGLPHGFGNTGFRASNPHEEASGIARLNQMNRERAAEVWGSGGAPR